MQSILQPWQLLLWALAGWVQREQQEGEKRVRSQTGPRLPGWVGRVNQLLGEKEEENLRRCIRRGSPFGDEGWVESTARQLHLESTVRARGRPRTFSQFNR